MNSYCAPRPRFGYFNPFVAAIGSSVRAVLSIAAGFFAVTALAVPAPSGPSTINFTPPAKIIQGVLTASETYSLTITGLVTASPANPVSIDLGFSVLSAPLDVNSSTAYALDFIKVTDASGNPVSSIVTSTTGTFTTYITVNVPAGNQVGDYLWKIKPTGYPANNGWPDNAGTVIDPHDGATVNAKVLPEENEQIPLVIAVQPLSQDVLAGSDVTFTVAATGNDPLSYQWRKGNTAIPGATSPTLALTSVTALDAGDYTVLVSDQFDSAVSEIAVLTVTQLNATVTLDNLSHTYDGTPKQATASTTPVGLPVSLSYTFNGNPATPLDAGSYPVTATITDILYQGSASDTLVIAKAPQTITFGPLAPKFVNSPSFSLTASASSLLPVSYVSSNPAVATVSGNSVTIVGLGSTTITASQPGNHNYLAAVPVEQTLTVTKLDQTITFGALPTKTVADAPFALTASASSGLPVSYISSNPAVATVSGNTVTIVASGTTIITASQGGNALYNPALSVSQPLVVQAGVQNKTISGAVFFDLNTNGSLDGADFGLAGISLELRDGANQLVAAQASASDGSYSFSNVAPGAYTVSALAPAGLVATNSNTRAVTISTSDVAAPPIGFGLDFPAMCGMAANGYSHGFWKTNIGKALQGKKKGVQIPAAQLAEYTALIGDLALTPYDGLTLSQAYAILSSNSSHPAVLLSKQLLASEYNYANGAYIGGNHALTLAFITWGEYLLAHCDEVSADELLFAKDWFDAYNNSHGGAFCGPSAPAPAPTLQVVLTSPSAGEVFDHTTGTAALDIDFAFASAVTAPFTIDSVAATLNNVPVAVTTVGLGTASAESTGVLLSVPAGTHTLTVTASSGSASQSQSVTFTVRDVPSTSPLPAHGVAIVRHGFSLNGGIDGSVQVLLPEDVTLNGNAWIAGDLFVPGTPQVKLNGKPTYGGTQDGSGAAWPAKHDITLNGKAVLGHVVRRTDAVTMPCVDAPPAPTGTRKVTLNSSRDNPGDFATIRDLTLNGKVGEIAVPPGTYGKLTANGNSGFVFGVAGSDTPAVYNLQDLKLNGNSELRLAGPVILTLADGITLNGNVGSTDQPEWLVLRIASDGLTLNGNIEVGAFVLAPKGKITINGKSKLTGLVVCDELRINGNAVLEIVE